MAKPIDEANVREVLERSGDRMTAHKIAVWLGYAKPTDAQRASVEACANRLIGQRLAYQQGGGSSTVVYKWGQPSRG